MGLLNNCWVQEMKNIGILLSITLLSGAVQAFEFEGYTSGMTHAEVESKASKYGKTSVEDGNLIAEFGNGNYLSFNFCNDHLVSLQQGQPQNVRQLSLIIEEFIRIHGQPISVQAGGRASPRGRIQELGMWWGGPKEYVSVSYMSIGDTGESLSTSRQVKNACFKVPR